MKERNKLQLFLLRLLSLFFILLFFPFCESPPEQGELVIFSQREGTYELYKQEPKEHKLISTELGSYNRPLTLEVGKYFIFSECSKKEIEIQKKQKIQLQAHSLSFEPPKGSLSYANFFVECATPEEMPHPGLFEKKFSFHFFHENEKIKVNKKILPLEFKNEGEGSAKKITLSSLRLSSPGIKYNKKYFLSSQDASDEGIQAEKLNSERLLAPGDYHLSLNGSEKMIHLSEGEKRVIKLAIVKVAKPDTFEESRQLNRLAKSYHIYMNKEYRLFFNESTPVFSGMHTFHFEGSKESEVISIQEGERKTLKPKSILVSSLCKEGQKDCLGEKDVFLFNESKEQFFVGKTDVSLFYFNGPIGVGFINSKGLTYWASAAEKKVKMGTLLLKPFKKFKQGTLSEFARLEPNSPKVSGYSQDISHTKNTKLDLIEGKYKLILYINSENAEEKKQKVTYIISVQGGHVTTKEFPFYVSEKQLEST